MILQPLNLRWIGDVADDPTDLCAHGDIEFRIGDDDVLLGENGRNLTVSAAGLYLLRTVSLSHTKTSPVGDHLFPCCGFAMWDIPGEEDVALSGCPNGVDVQVSHETHGPGVRIRAANGRDWLVTSSEWRAAVFAFADRVSAFYACCSSKQPSADDVAGFAKFRAEWERRRGARLG